MTEHLFLDKLILLSFGFVHVLHICMCVCLGGWMRGETPPAALKVKELFTFPAQL